METLQDHGAVRSSDSKDVFVHKGIFDAHIHLSWAGSKAKQFDFERQPDWRAFENFVASSTVNFVKSYGLDENKMSASLDEMEETFLQVCRRHPHRELIVYRVCGHLALVSPNLAQRYQLPARGAWIEDRGIHRLHDLMPPASCADFKDSFLKMQTEMLSRGITAVGEMSLVDAACEALIKLCQDGRLLIDIQGVLEAGRAPQAEAFGPRLVSNRDAIGPLDRAAELQMRHWKLYLDGSMGARTAWLSQPYSDAETFGLQLVNGLELLERSSQALKKGFFLSFHAIGDAAVDQILDLGDSVLGLLKQSRRALDSWGWAPSQHRIEHAQVLREDQLSRIAQQGWCLVLQPHHRVADAVFVESRLGPRFPGLTYRAGSLLRAGIPIALSTDAPVDFAKPREIVNSLSHHPVVSERILEKEALWLATVGARSTLGLRQDPIELGSTVFLTEL
jgi:predicted amidohydrolase YtcJ